MPAKRKTIDSDIPRKRRKPSRRRASLGSESSFPLFDLPTEVLDLVISHVITVPWHPVNGAFSLGVIGALFPKQLIHANRLLRQRTIDVVSKSVLWLEVNCRDRSAMHGIRGLKLAFPTFPSAYSNLLSDSIQKVSFELGDPKRALRTTRSLQEEHAIFLFPFNYQSLTVLSSRLLGCVREIKHVTIHVSQLSAAFQHVLEQQIMPIARFFRYSLNVEILRKNRKPHKIAKKILEPLHGIAQKILEIIDMMCDLDNNGLKLEATLLCIYHGLHLKVLAEFDPEIGRLSDWAHPTGKLGLPDWQTDPVNLARMKAIRSLHHIEYRACLGYIEAVDTFGYEFARCHYEAVSNLPLINLGNARWADTMNNISYGLPDHELAEMHFAKALVFQHIWLDYDSFLEDRLLDGDWEYSHENTASEAFCWAYYAWSLDMNNLNYGKLLLDLETTCDHDSLVAFWCEMQANDDDASHHSGNEYYRIHPKVLRDWTLTSEHALEYLGRAQEVAKLADVQYDKRRAQELPSGFTEASRKAQKDMFQLGRPWERWGHDVKVEEHHSVRFDEDVLVGSGDGLDDGDYLQDFHDIAPWDERHQMWKMKQKEKKWTV